LSPNSGTGIVHDLNVDKRRRSLVSIALRAFTQPMGFFGRLPCWDGRHCFLDQLSHFRRGLRYTPLRWTELFYGTAFILLTGVLDIAGVKEDHFILLCYYMEEGIDPNVNRVRLLTPWISTENYQSLNRSN